jgi:hypothetical protein
VRVCLASRYHILVTLASFLPFVYVHQYMLSQRRVKVPPAAMDRLRAAWDRLDREEAARAARADDEDEGEEGEGEGED